MPASGPVPESTAALPAPQVTARLSGSGAAVAAAVLTGQGAQEEAPPTPGDAEPTDDESAPAQADVPADTAPLAAAQAAQVLATAAQMLAQAPAQIAPAPAPAPNQQTPTQATNPVEPAEVPSPQLEAFVKQAVARVEGKPPQQLAPADDEVEASTDAAQPRFADLIKLVAEAEGSPRQGQATAEEGADAQPQTPTPFGQQGAVPQRSAHAAANTSGEQPVAVPPERPLKAEPKPEAQPVAELKAQQAPARPEAVTQPEPARTPDPEPVVRQVSRFIKVMVDSERSEVRLNLHPEQLGSVAVKLVLEGAQVKASLTAQDAAVRHVLEANLDQLKNRLADQGLQVTEVHVTVGDDGGFGQPQQSHQESQKQPREQQGRPAFRQTLTEDEAATPDPTRQTPPAWARRWMGSRINSLA